MRQLDKILVLALVTLGGLANTLTAEEQVRAATESPRPPFRGTIFDFPDLMKTTDATAFQSIEFVATGRREMFDRRVNKFQEYDVFLFRAAYGDRDPMEVAVNREFETQEKAQEQAEFYADAFGRLPLFLRKEIQSLHIQAGKKLFGGGRNVLIHTEQGESYRRNGILEETLGHEAAHALDRKHARHEDWKSAQEQDGIFISKYAKENPYREDIAESVIPYLAVRFRPERIRREQKQTIQQTIPARMKYFDTMAKQGFPKKADRADLIGEHQPDRSDVRDAGEAK